MPSWIRKKSSWTRASRRRGFSKRSSRRYGVPYGLPRSPIVKRSFAKSLMSTRGVGLGPSLQTQLKTIFFNDIMADASGMVRTNLASGSIYDPAGPITTIQPAEYDQWAQFFGRYVVTGGSVKVTILPSLPGGSTQNPNAFVACMYPSIDTTVKADFQGAASQDWSVTGIGGANQGPVVLYQRWSHAALLGKKGPVTSEDNGALIAANPAAGQSIFHNLFIQWAVATGNVFTCMFEITQDVYFDRRIPVDTE